MDTGTHFVMGIGLYGLAHLDPIVATDPVTSHAVLFATAIGSQMPDFDGLYRLKGNSAYIRNHRGWTHSLPMLLIWPTILTAILNFFFPQANWQHVWLWGLLAVFIHVFIDLFNTYGTQALKPFCNKWISWDVINIFDPFLFIIHLFGFALWSTLPVSPGWIFAGIYLILIFYVGWRTWVHAQKVKWLTKQVGEPGKYTVIPTARWNDWKIVFVQENKVRMGEIRDHTINWTGELSTKDLKHPAAIKSREAEPIDAFLSFTSYGYPRVYTRSYGYEVRWFDVRYHHKKHFPFVAVALLDHDYHIIDSFVGWISEEQLDKKVQHMLS
ncbi:metal-dependent hydrolase [Thermoflavimicrobium dichotomicum]|uniref:Inner membrane protein n=1 Tax=Thermoflavimicrobium dichotomicum TaxID=46223 RepID=A0A1I3JFJ6_9BACL|nr:metal-dependent hydrolase [Thermoflavimicrobium dichotomicum]SFI58880.1 inner membrane protein [Thermoflavimicrobium dichotomicum]